MSKSPKGIPKLIYLDRVHTYGPSCTKFIVAGFLMAFLVWPFVRFPEPEFRVTSFAVDGVDPSKPNKNDTLIHYSLSIRNPDIYKRVRYNVLFLHITFSGYNLTKYGATVDLDFDGKGLQQHSRQTTLLANHTIDYAANDVGWNRTDMVKLQKLDTYIDLSIIMDVSFMAFNRVIGTRQRTRTAKVYFGYYRIAQIYPVKGLKFK